MLRSAVFRGGIPLIIMSGISFFLAQEGKQPAQVRGTFITGLIITTVAAASVIYDIKSWSLRKQLLAHFLLMVFTVLPLLYVSGWFPLQSGLDYLFVFGIFSLVGLVLVSVFLLYFLVIDNFFKK